MSTSQIIQDEFELYILFWSCVPHFALFPLYLLCAIYYISFCHIKSEVIFYYSVRSWCRCVFGYNSDATGFTSFFTLCTLIFIIYLICTISRKFMLHTNVRKIYLATEPFVFVSLSIYITYKNLFTDFLVKLTVNNMFCWRLCKICLYVYLMCFS